MVRGLKSIVLALLIAALVPIGAARAQAGPDTKPQATIAWVSAYAEVMNEATSGFASALPDTQALLARARAGERATLAVELRKSAGEMRSSLTGSSARLVALRATAPPATEDGFNPTDFIDEGLAYFKQAQDVVTAIDEMGKAIASEDYPGMQRAVRTLARSGLVLIEGQIAIVRARRKVLTPDDPTYHALGVQLAFSQATANTFVSALAISDKRALPANARENLRLAAANAEASAKSGRQALAAHQAELGKATTGASSNDHATIANIRAVYAIEAETFDLADEIASALRTIEVRLGSSPSSEMTRAAMAELSNFELRLQAIATRQIAAIGGQ